MVLATSSFAVRMIALLAAVFCCAASARCQGLTVTGVGPINRSMGGAGTAAPLDSIGALHWNPASISWLEQSEISFGMEGLLADVDLTTNIGGVSHSTSGEAGVSMIPAVGWVQKIEGTPVTIGLGVSGIAGFRNNLPTDSNNLPLASGPIFADAEIMQFTPTISYAITDQLSFGVSPTISTGRIMFDPLGPSAITPGTTQGTGNRVHWGGGVQAGLYYACENGWRTGLSIKSPQWFEEFRFFTPSGVAKFDLDYPMILSGGIAYYGWERWVFAADVRYFDYANTAGFNALGWRSVAACAFGVQYQLNDIWQLRSGINFNQNPIPSEATFANIANPLIQQQNLAFGASCSLTHQVDLTLAYVYLFKNDLTGALPSPPFGPNDTLTNEISAHSLAMGIRVRY